MRRTAPTVILLTAAVALNACSTFRPSEPAEPIVLTMSDSGRAVSISAGQEFEVRLASNPTTGYQWALVSSDEGIVSTQGEPAYVPDAAAPGTAGSGGVEVWRFKGMRAGVQVLAFEYRRPWEVPPTAAESATYSITVR